MADDAKPARDYRDTVFLPETPFPMRAGLPKLEPQILERWRTEELFPSMRKVRQRSRIWGSSLGRPARIGNGVSGRKTVSR